MASPTTITIGLMSGTSLDGVDGVVADFRDGTIRTIGTAFVPFAPALRGELMTLQAASDNEIEHEALAANLLAGVYADCVRALLPLANGPVNAIAVHGQTIRHRPELGFTRQTNNPALLAELVGIDVIADFRSRDVAAGGQGAPLVPAFHQAMFGLKGQTRVLVNIGGISNISVISDERVDGFDTGPGNMLMDAWVHLHQGTDYDADGAWAAGGKVHQGLLAVFLAEPYFSLPAPKSTGRDLFDLPWLDRRLAMLPGGAGSVAPQDVQATLCALTARTIADGIKACKKAVDVVYVCGGGAYNGTLMRMMAEELGGKVNVESTDVLGVAPNCVEALAFAWLGYQFLQRKPGNLPSVTGARGARILGALYPA